MTDAFRSPTWCLVPRCGRITFDPQGRCPLHHPNGQMTRTLPIAPMPRPDESVRTFQSITSPMFTGVEQWRVDSDLSRADGPALVYHLANGEILSEEWYLHGRRSRFGGPAEVNYLDNGAAEEKWVIDGRDIGEKDYFHYLGQLGKRDLREGFYPSGWAPALDRGVDPWDLLDAIESGVRTPDGAIAVAIDGAPAEWAKAFELGKTR